MDRVLGRQISYHFRLEPPATVRILALLPATPPDNLTMQLVWRRVMLARERAGLLDQKAFVKVTKLPQSTVSRWELGKGQPGPDPVQLVRIARACDVKVAWLLHVPDEPYEPPVDLPPEVARMVQTKAQEIMALVEAFLPRPRGRPRKRAAQKPAAEAAATE